MNMTSFFFIILTFFINSCDKPWFVDRVYSITVENQHADTIQIFPSYDYPDTLIAVVKPRLKMVYPEKYSRIDSKEKWEDVLPNNIISIFILSKDTVDTYSWEEIRSDYNILKRYDYTIEQLENQDWTITYP